MSKLFDNIAAKDRNIASRWQIRTRDNEKHILTAAEGNPLLSTIAEVIEGTGVGLSARVRTDPQFRLKVTR